MFGKLRRRLELPKMRPELAMGLLVVWGLSLVLLDYGAKIEARVPVPVVGSIDDCDLDIVPAPAAIVHVMHPGETALVRNSRDANVQSRCYEVETPDGTRGWIPWHPDYMRGAGVYVRVGR